MDDRPGSPTTTPAARRHRPRLRGGLPVLQRSSGHVQVGCDPERALLLTPPDGVRAHRLAALLRALDGTASAADLNARFSAGPDGLDVAGVLRTLADSGLLERTRRPDASSIRIHGRGPIAESLCANLRARPVTVTRSARYTADTAVRRWGAVLVVLTDQLVADPRLVADLIAACVPHLQVRIRDGRGIVGPLVLPGTTSCLVCADLHRRDSDPEWPELSAQLLGHCGQGDQATTAATAALAATEIDRVLAAAGRSGPLEGVSTPPDTPTTLNATVELDLSTNSLHTRRWSTHPLCRCTDAAPPFETTP